MIKARLCGKPQQPVTKFCVVLAGIRRVALLDFDVHHGNGTEACVRETAPSLRKFNFKTPFSEGSQTFPVYSPWLDTDDADNILFARYAVLCAMLVRPDIRDSALLAACKSKACCETTFVLFPSQSVG